ncbi:hypothetical protein [Rubellimicrobium mesophilum]|uniref:hypothetical protein n=1 Tax=Rubellimicrobium mesophilum TaxID=1123067 RepID=UPI0012E11722|nr:hypothetical protein [Rubellimicrobium mesophilum]
MIPLDEMPFLLWMPTYKTEASFLGELPEDQVSSDEDAFVVITEHPERVGQKLASHGADLVSANIDHLAFARMLAKIALGYCVMTFSRGGFVPIVNPLILGNTDRFRTLVASSQPKEDGFIDPKKFRPELRHEIVHRIVQTGMIQVRITLFANLNGPPYHVLAGVQGNSTLVYRETENGLSVRSLIAQPLIP